MKAFVTEIVGGEPYEYYPLGQYIVRASGVCGGRPTFKYTRIEIERALNRLAAGENIEELLLAYRGRVSKEALLEAIELVTTQYINTLPEFEHAG